MTTAVTEQEVFEGTITEAESSVIRGVKLLGLRSRNRRNYDTEGVRRTAKVLFEGAKVFIDHPQTPDQPRSYRDSFGVVEGYEYRPGAGHFGNIRYNPEHPLAKQFAWDVTNAAKNLGMSVNARIMPGKVDRSGDLVVESLEMVRSVDIVTKPATADGIFEHEEDDLMTIDLKTLKEKHPDLVEQLLSESQESTKTTAELMSAQKALQEAQEQLASLKAAEDARKLKEALEADFGSLFKDSVTLSDADLQKEIVECACQLAGDAQKSFREVVSKISKVVPAVEDTDDDEVDADDDDADATDTESARSAKEQEEEQRSSYRPGRSKDKKRSLRDLLKT